MNSFWYLRVKPLPHVFSFLIFLLNTNQVVCFCGLVHHDPFCRSTCSQASQQSFLYPSENFEFPQWHFQKNLYASQIICVNKWTKDISETYIFNMYVQNFSSDLFFCMSYHFLLVKKLNHSGLKLLQRSLILGNLFIHSHFQAIEEKLSTGKILDGQTTVSYIKQDWKCFSDLRPRLKSFSNTKVLRVNATSRQ